MIGTVAVLIALSTLFFTVVLRLMGVMNLMSVALLVVLFNIAQWLFAPYLINAMCRVKEVSVADNARLYGIVERLSQKIGIRAPKLMIADIPIPNAFAYGSPIAGTRVAVTNGLLRDLEEEEVEAVLGHELGHLKNRDVQVMMFASILPAIFYFIGYSMMMSTWYGGTRQRDSGGAAPALIGMGSMAIYYVLTLFVLGLSRMREYYADQRSVSIVEDGARKLSEALAKIVSSNSRMKLQRQRGWSFNSFKALFIEDPDSAQRDTMSLSENRMFSTDQQLVREVLSRPVSATDRILELLSTHPNIVKRLQALQSSM
jgi:heat shock protein HtpX